MNKLWDRKKFDGKITSTSDLVATVAPQRLFVKARKHRANDSLAQEMNDFLASTPRRFMRLKCNRVDGQPEEEVTSVLADDSILSQDNVGVRFSSASEVERHKDTLHHAIAPILVAAQCFGIMPVEGILGPSPRSLRFRVRSFRFVYTLTVWLCIGVLEVLSVCHMINALRNSAGSIMTGIGAATAGAVFYGNACLALYLFLKLAKKWPRLLSSWSEMERVLWRWSCPRLVVRFNVITAVIMLLALGEEEEIQCGGKVEEEIQCEGGVEEEVQCGGKVEEERQCGGKLRKFSVEGMEHILSMLTNIPEILAPGKSRGPICPLWDSDDPEPDDFLRVYCCHSHRFIFTTVEYRSWIGGIVFIGSKLATFVWNYTDLFLILVSIGLSERFKQINKRMLTVNRKVRLGQRVSKPKLVHRQGITPGPQPSGAFLRREEWRELREHYAMLSTLTKNLDSDVSGIVLLSFANNLYFICLQLLNGLSPNLNGGLDSVYFFGSFAFLLARTLTVTLFTARINDESRIALPVLYNCPSVSYCEEVGFLLLCNYQENSYCKKCRVMHVLPIDESKVRRLQTQITTDEISLTGLRFFSVTRNFMLAVAGAIVTYEVVLLQFNVAMLSGNHTEPGVTTPNGPTLVS
uniref:Gustatory receptor n=1 Tax=Timema monikensis TaxID=170555 RepID=A0A7R9HR83_9NEOP|nr:unnamed protein product [Timema monikensis]